MTHKEFLAILQKRIASGAVTPSAARRMGPKGTIRAAREFLATRVVLEDVGSSGEKFAILLDRLTLKLMRALPKEAQHWGAARKFLNIFLRDATYNFYLREAYQLDRIESRLEVPLDSHVAKALKQEMNRLNLKTTSLPRWKTVVSLDRSRNKSYQDAVRLLATEQKIDPVHFDVIAWRRESGYL